MGIVRSLLLKTVSQFLLLGFTLAIAWSNVGYTHNPNVVIDVAPQIAPEPRFTEQELTLIAKVVMSEARGEPEESQRGVAQTIYTRVTAWNRSVEDVVLAKGQFAPPYKGEPTDRVREIVNEVFIQGIMEFDSPVTHFYAYEICDPYWVSDKQVAGTRGGHRFLY